MKRSHIAALAVLIVNVLLLIALGLSWLSFVGLSGELESQQAAKRFGSGKNGFAQVSAFFPDGKGITYKQVTSLRTAIEKYLEEQTVEALTPEAPIYRDAFSFKASEIRLTGSGTRADVTANVIAVGGDFFTFHPFPLMSGSYISEDDIQHNRIVIDDQTAWVLFGSSDVAGKYVTISGNYYKIAGVIRTETDEYSKAAYNLSFDNRYPLIFVPYEMLESDTTEVQFSTYEFVTQSLFTTFVRDMFKVQEISSSAAPLANAELKLNTNRFSIPNTYEVLMNLSARSVRTSTIVYPYWENAARIIESKLAIRLVILIALAVIPLFSLIYLFGWLLKNTKGKGKVVAEFFSDRWDFFRRLRWNRELRKAEKANKKSNADERSPELPELAGLEEFEKPAEPEPPDLAEAEESTEESEENN
ncbi:MAG: ABC transporter permease [Oscillospiraceae bacterium]|jgi:hypothetical protein|nr:ABC transporter permease [Oscillospiraceae bacterium]